MSHGSNEKRKELPREVLLPVTRLVSTLSMTIQNGQLVARPAAVARRS